MGQDDGCWSDGSLCGSYDGFESPNMVGVIKSHQTQYFPWEEQRKILNLGGGERSGVFVPGGRKRPRVYSWYLRLRPNDGRDMYFAWFALRLRGASEHWKWRTRFPGGCWRREARSACRTPLGQDDISHQRLRAVLEKRGSSHISLDAMMMKLTSGSQASRA